MSVSPINITRVSHNLRTESMLYSVRRNLVTMFQDQNRLATGRRFLTASEDPIAASQALRFHESIDRQDQILSNLRHAELTLGAADDALVEVSDLLAQAESIASRSIGAQADADERRANAALIAEIREQLMIVGNRQLNDRFLFAGRDSQNAPFVSAIGGVAYVGDTGDLFARVSRYEQEPINVTGNVLFGALSASVGGDVDMSPNATRETRLEELGGATLEGIRKGTIIVTDGADTYLQIDVSDADTLGDVVDTFNEATTDAGLTATLDVDGRGLAVTPGGLSIQDIAQGTVAADLGIVVSSGDPAPAAAVDLSPRLTPATRIEHLNDGNGVDLTSGINIINGPRSATIDLSQAETVQDVLNEINTAGLFVHASVSESGSGIEIVSQVSGVDLSVSEAGGTTASELGLLNFRADTPLESLNGGRGVETLAGEPDLRIFSKDGSTIDVDLDTAETIGHVIDLINTAAGDAGVNITASLGTTSSGVVISDDTGGSGPLSVTRASLASFAVDDLGLAKTVADPETVLVGDDVAAVRPNGIFSALLELERSLLDDDERGVAAVAEQVTEFSRDVVREHGIVGARAKLISSRVEQTENAVTATRSFLSDIEDLDYAEAVTRFQQAQTALQANLLSGSQLLNLSLLDFLQ